MTPAGGRTIDIGRILAAAEAASPVESVEGLARELGSTFGATSVSFLITDLSGRGLVRLANVPLVSGDAGAVAPLLPGERREDTDSATVLPFDGGPEEQAVRTQTVQVDQVAGLDAGDGSVRWRVLAPVTQRGESVGLLDMFLPASPSPEVVSEIAQVAHLLAFVVIANRRHTDLFEWGQRSRPFTLSAEIQQRLLPGARTCEGSSFTLSGWLEPAASIGGDTFDYSLARDLLHLSLTDAMGHGVNAALTASVCLGGLRGGRRKGMSLVEQAAETNTALSEHAAFRAGDDFVTGMLGRLDLTSGCLDLVNAGHVAPFLLRDSVLQPVELDVNLPLGMFTDSGYRSTRLELVPGDRIVFVTDGMLERHATDIDLESEILETRHLHPREVVRALADRALEAAGHALEDDATVLVLDWHGPHHGLRDSTSGADQDRASSPLTAG